jgi:hypothetical protein
MSEVLLSRLYPLAKPIPHRFRLSAVVHHASSAGFSKMHIPRTTSVKELIDPCHGNVVYLKNQNRFTETLVWKQASHQAKQVLFMVPGNPGVVDFYHEFLDTGGELSF